VKGETRRCGVIMTTRANDVFAQIHNSKQRQAVVIHKEDQEKWLDPETPVEELIPLMQPLGNEETHFAPAVEPPAELPLFR